MALQDLTPQLRTRLSRMERAVGWFVILATALLVFGFAYYVYNTAQRRGWFLTKAPYFTFTDRATGLRVGDPVMLMGFNVGQITEITAMPAEQFVYNVYVEFDIRSPFYGYMWTVGSRAKVTTSDLLGNRVLEVTKGTGGYPTYIFNPMRELALSQIEALPAREQWQLAEDIYDASGLNIAISAFEPLTHANLTAIANLGVSRIRILDPREERRSMTGVWDDRGGYYRVYSRDKPYWLPSDESPALGERMERLIDQVEVALPNILNLTNQLANVLSNTATLTAHLSDVAVAAQPAVSNLSVALAQLDQPGALGQWLLPTNVNQRLESVLASADATMTGANTNLAALADNLSRSLDNLASMTSNLNTQVQANTNILSEISRAIVNTDDLVQGLKQHWLFRSAFRSRAPGAPQRPVEPLRSPKDEGTR
jgi:hypothetical protein